jgi:hypothetical protein
MKAKALFLDPGTISMSSIIFNLADTELSFEEGIRNSLM